VIELRNLTCHYGERQVLRNISVCVKDHVCVLGANGSGKSTLAKALCRLIDYNGSILYDGMRCNAADLAQEITYIPAKLESYDPYISVEEFVLLGRFPHKERFIDYSDKDRAIVSKTLQQLNLQPLASQALHTLSSGEQQLVLIAQALTQQSRTIIFDEPTANLDPANVKKVANIIKMLKRSYRVILISHDLHLAHYFDAPILFIADGDAVLYKKNETFFEPAMLSHHYGVAFDGLAVRYD
jgi:iron complex transport system ATP-binding protein